MSSSSSKGKRVREETQTVLWRQVNLSSTSEGAEKLEQVQSLLQDRWANKQVKKFDKADACARSLQEMKVSYDDEMKTWFFKTKNATSKTSKVALAPGANLDRADRRKKVKVKVNKDKQKKVEKVKKDSAAKGQAAGGAQEEEPLEAEQAQKKRRS
jgi:hypothetical protein